VRNVLVGRVLPFVLMFLAVGGITAAAVGLVYAKGLAFTVSFTGALLQVPLVAAMGLASWAVLTRVKKLSVPASGLTWDARAGKGLGLGVLGGVLIMGLAVGLLAAAGAVPLALSSYVFAGGRLRKRMAT